MLGSGFVFAKIADLMIPSTQIFEVVNKRSSFLGKYGCIWRKANISVGAKHDRRKYGIITNNLYAVMLRPLPKPDAPGNIASKSW
jgi:hypothetical protein